MLESLFQTYDSVIVLDTETTGVNCKSDEIIELGFLRHHIGKHDGEHNPGVAFDPADAEREGVQHGKHDGGHSHYQRNNQAVPEFQRELGGGCVLYTSGSGDE